MRVTRNACIQQQDGFDEISFGDGDIGDGRE